MDAALMVCQFQMNWEHKAGSTGSIVRNPNYQILLSHLSFASAVNMTIMFLNNKETTANTYV